MKRVAKVENRHLDMNEGEGKNNRESSLAYIHCHVKNT